MSVCVIKQLLLKWGDDSLLTLKSSVYLKGPHENFYVTQLYTHKRPSIEIFLESGITQFLVLG